MDGSTSYPVHTISTHLVQVPQFKVAELSTDGTYVSKYWFSRVWRLDSGPNLQPCSWSLHVFLLCQIHTTEWWTICYTLCFAFQRETLFLHVKTMSLVVRLNDTIPVFRLLKVVLTVITVPLFIIIIFCKVAGTSNFRKCLATIFTKTTFRFVTVDNSPGTCEEKAEDHVRGPHPESRVKGWGPEDDFSLKFSSSDAKVKVAFWSRENKPHQELTWISSKDSSEDEFPFSAGGVSYFCGVYIPSKLNSVFNPVNWWNIFRVT